MCVQGGDIVCFLVVFLNYRSVELSTKEAIIKMFKCRSFYVIWVSTLCGAIGLEFVLSSYKVLHFIWVLLSSYSQ